MFTCIDRYNDFAYLLISMLFLQLLFGLIAPSRRINYHTVTTFHLRRGLESVPKTLIVGRFDDFNLFSRRGYLTTFEGTVIH